MPSLKVIVSDEKENEDDLERVCTPDEPLIFLPSAISTVSITDRPVEKGHVSEKFNRCTQFSGAFYTLLGSFLFTCTAFSIKQLGVDLLDALLLRFVIQTLITFSYVRYKQYPIFFGNRTQIFLQFLCCATGAAGLYLCFIAIRYVELSDVTTLSYTRVVWTVVFSIFIYRERPSWSTLVALPITLLGVVFVAQPSFLFSSTVSSMNGKLRILGLSLSMLSSFTATTNVLTFKKLVCTSKDIKPSVINFQYCVAVLISLLINQFYKTFILHTGLTLNFILSWRYILASLVCLIMILVNIITQKAMKREHPAIFSLLGSADIIFSLILQNIFTSKHSNLFALLGSTLVIFSVVIIGMAKILNENSAHKKIKLVNNDLTMKDFEEKIGKC
ncbi:hypothetical protein I4U23_029571 [Adineta vaga]|nr:hypothetical protein I4U23_029571 [Adineta vaga]